MCEKQRFASAAKAKATQQWAGQKKARLRAYRCRECQSWHITTRVSLDKAA